MLRSRPLTVMLILVICVILAADTKSVLPLWAAGFLLLYSFVRVILVKLVHRKQKVAYGLILLSLAALFAYGIYARTTARLSSQTVAEKYYKTHDKIQVRGEIYAIEEGNDSVAYYLKNVIADGKKLNRTICYVKDDLSKQEFLPGDIVEAIGKPSMPQQATNEGGFDARNFYRSRNIYGRIGSGSIKQIHRPRVCVSAGLWKIRRKILRFYGKSLPGEESGILGAIALGSRADLEEEARNLFQMSGLAHILAISGMHIGVVGLGIWRLLRRRTSYWVSGFVSSTVLILYCLMTGGSISAVRAVIMCIVHIAGQALGEASDSLSSLSLAGILLLWVNPGSLKDSSFIFSFVAVSGVILVASELQKRYESLCMTRWEKVHFRQHGDRWKPSLKEMVISNLIFSAAMQLVTLPLVAEYYYEIPVYVTLLNLILLPLLSWLLGLGLIGGFAGAIGLSVGGAPQVIILFAGRVCLRICHYMIYLYEWMADLSLRLPFSRYITGKPPLWSVILFYGVLLICVQGKQFLGIQEKAGDASGKSSGIRREGSTTRERFLEASRIVTICAVTMLILHFPFSHPTEITMLDVGQGECLYLCDGNGFHMMIDGGSTDVDEVGSRRILPFLKSRGVRHIDIWFVSHTDQDHISGILEALESGYQIERLVFSEPMREEARREAQVNNYDALCSVAKEHGTKIVMMKAGDVFYPGPAPNILSLQNSDNTASDRLLYSKHAMNKRKPVMEIDCLWPHAKPVSHGTNENALVLLVRYGSFTGIFGGDIGEAEEKRIVFENEDVFRNMHGVNLYKVDHHGSNYSSCEEYLQALRPDMVWISAGRNNLYGHPGEKALARISSYAHNYFCTISNGQITVRWVDDSPRQYVMRKESFDTD